MTGLDPVPTYFDTSAFAKRYIAEAGSDQVHAFLASHGEDNHQLARAAAASGLLVYSFEN